MSQDDRSQDRILFLLKTRGAQTAAEIGARLDMTSVGARQHLLKLETAGLVESEDRRQGRGRPRKCWRLTQQGHGRFPDRHSELTLELLRSTRELFGEDGLERLIEHREHASIALYRRAVDGQRSLRGKLAALADIRSREGYMADVVAEARGGFLFIENHCPICAAAMACQGLCRSELTIFRAVLGKEVAIERIDHILAGARRCAYRVGARPLPVGRSSRQ
ncbi:Predicted transcriptional regulator, ArsR family [Enhydrobacter aerosaccus]|uniref:Predicted transcriptional regulator, ArsR family n=1 Tax=Enhydrobacter aerosaccus TaxID=225324 RepID=A0A1T4KH10_9HYPH|nr:metalloregulator ArsR/SmtB family transcription factor [Enhydrobacter aerosaccus]SJZ41712.1 Predicted transcriptional regulator, ArsR family [Enhydrobacter aerosaccus]